MNKRTEESYCQHCGRIIGLDGDSFRLMCGGCLEYSNRRMPLTPTTTPPTVEERERAASGGGEWKLVGYSYQIADTGDYDGYYEITNGKLSILTKDDDDEALQPIVDALNSSGAKFYQDGAVEFELHLEKQENAALQSRISELEEENRRLSQQQVYIPCGDNGEYQVDDVFVPRLNTWLRKVKLSSLQENRRLLSGEGEGINY